mmetsp:Transcript_91928/g.177036  ORF Transcript_91928/g.177036 Transcript_91928/m.177036 type:complete len:451 (-) Transcript_91928:62-1414(-)
MPLQWRRGLQSAGEGFEFSEPVPWGYHNIFVLSVIFLTLLWIAKVGHQIWDVAVIRQRLTLNRPLYLERMSIYAKDFQQLIRQHFNQILRMRRMVPPRDVSQQALCVHMHPESLEAFGNELLGVRFTVDSLAPCTMRLYWGVPVAACNALLRQSGGASSSGLDNSTGPTGTGRSTRRVAPAEAVARWPAALAPLLPQGPGPSATATSASSAASSSAAEGLMSGSLVEIAERPVASTSAGGGSGSAAGPPTNNRELFAAEDCKLRSSPVALPASLGHRCETPVDGRVDRRQPGLDLTGAGLNLNSPGAAAQRDGGVMPLVIALTERRPSNNDGQVSLLELPTVQAHTQVSFVRFKCSEASGSALVPEVLQQVVFGDDGTAHRVLGIFGFEEEENGEEVDCMICYDRPRSVLLLPCRHCSVCSSCLRSLRDERCPLCRAVFSAYLLFPLPAA